MKEIPLTKGQVTLVDDADYDWLMERKWMALAKPQGGYYATRTEWVDGRRTTVYMHREIMQPPQGMKVDHVDRDSLHNWRSNLRIATDAENVQNSAGKTNRLYPYKGIGFNHKPLARPWYAVITVDHHRLHLGYYATMEEAARAYDAAAIEECGEFGYQNFPNKT